MFTVPAAGVDIPVVGLGTWRLTGEACAELVARAVHTGYRHVDTAVIYENEREVGEGLRHSGVPRDELFVTSKVWMDAMTDGPLQRSAEQSLERLGLDRLDLLLIHWPNAAVPLAETMKALGKVKRRGLARAIGVSNFTVALMQEAAALCPEPLAVNQVERHPFLSQRRVREACRRLGMALTAYSPLAQGAANTDPTLAAMAAELELTPAQLVIRWLIQQEGVIAIPKTASIERAATNLDVFGFELTRAEMARISALARPDGRTISPDFSPEWDPPD